MYDALLIHALNPVTFKNTNPSLGLGYIASYVEAHSDFKVGIVHPGEYTGLEDSIENQIRIINRNKAPIIGISATELNYDKALDLASAIKKIPDYNPLVVLGGYATLGNLETDLAHNPNIDYVVRKEGEETFLELMTAYLNNNLIEFEEILGITYVDEHGKLVRNDNRPFISNLDDLPFPKREYVNSIWKNDNPYSTSISGSRGCYGCCSFCKIWEMYDRKTRTRNNEKIFEEIISVQKIKPKNRIFDFIDDDFLVDQKKGAKRLVTLADLLSNSKLKSSEGVPIRIKFQARANDYVSFQKEVEYAANKERLYRLDIGIEGFNLDHLTRWDKGNTKFRMVDENIKAVNFLGKLFEKYKVQAGLYLISFDKKSDSNSLKNHFSTSNIDKLDFPLFTTLFSLGYNNNYFYSAPESNEYPDKLSDFKVLMENLEDRIGILRQWYLLRHHKKLRNGHVPREKEQRDMIEDEVLFSIKDYIDASVELIDAKKSRLKRKRNKTITKIVSEFDKRIEKLKIVDFVLPTYQLEDIL